MVLKMGFKIELQSEKSTFASTAQHLQGALSSSPCFFRVPVYGDLDWLVQDDVNSVMMSDQSSWRKHNVLKVLHLQVGGHPEKFCLVLRTAKTIAGGEKELTGQRDLH